MYRIHGVVMVMLQVQVNNNGGSWLLDPSCSGGPRRKTDWQPPPLLWA